MQYLATTDYVIIVASLIVQIAVGHYFTKKGSADMDAFLLSGRSLTWRIAGVSMTVTSFAADAPL